MEQDQSGINNEQPKSRPDAQGRQDRRFDNRANREARPDAARPDAARPDAARPDNEPRPENRSDGQPNRAESRADHLGHRQNRDRQNNPRTSQQPNNQQPGQQQQPRRQENQPREPRPDNRQQGNRGQEPRPDAARPDAARPDNRQQGNRRQEPRSPEAPKPDIIASETDGAENRTENRQLGRPGESRQDRDRQRENDRNRQRNRDRNPDRDNAPHNDRDRNPDRQREPRPDVARHDDNARSEAGRNRIFADDDTTDDSQQGTLSPNQANNDQPFRGERLVIGITLGDYNGIGPEVILKALQYNQLSRICTPIIYGSMRVLNKYRNLLNLKDWNLNGIQHAGQASHKLTNVITCWNEQQQIPLPQQTTPTQAKTAEEATASEPVETAQNSEKPTESQPVTLPVAPPNYEVQPGKITPEAGMAALACLQRAVEDLKAGKLDALVTAPINKHNIQSDVFTFPGHTEYLTDAFGAADSLMFMVSEILRVGVVTGHVPLGRVRQNINRDKIHQKLAMMSQSLKRDFAVRRPRIAVLGLNPHAGENGLLGNEENEMITPLLNDLRNRGHLIYGPFPADGFFGTMAYKKYDAVLAMYHDQGLIPFKTIAFEEGVNFTAGLSIVRTSPDHGTAYDIAGKGIADETSMLQAIYTACDAARNRKEAAELEANALKK
jgi:4-hydroxythreonine-4-phosphate dehydrogenase